jgi:LmbE family N-acetylglucosaminyl deacetylase
VRISDIRAIETGYDHVYLSPHFDDAVLCCGGRILHQRGNGARVLVVTVFAGVGARRRPNSTLAGIVDTHGRRAEDAAAMELLDADYLWLDHLDAIFRFPRALARYRLRPAVGGTEAEVRTAISRDVGEILAAAGSPAIYAPLGIGQHADHQLVHEAALSLRGAGADVTWFEDVPYAAHPNVVRLRARLAGLGFAGAGARVSADAWPSWRETWQLSRLLAGSPTLQLGGVLLRLPITAASYAIELATRLRPGHSPVLHLVPELFDVTAGAQRKLDALGLYTSQLVGTLRNSDARERIFADYSRSIGAANGTHAERYWRSSSGPVLSSAG